MWDQDEKETGGQVGTYCPTKLSVHVGLSKDRHRGISSKVSHLLILGKASHDCRVHDSIEEHREWVDGKALITLVLVYHHQDLLISCGHGFNGILQRTNCGLLETRLAEEP